MPNQIGAAISVFETPNTRPRTRTICGLLDIRLLGAEPTLHTSVELPEFTCDPSAAAELHKLQGIAALRWMLARHTKISADISPSLIAFHGVWDVFFVRFVRSSCFSANTKLYSRNNSVPQDDCSPCSPQQQAKMLCCELHGLLQTATELGWDCSP